MKLAVVYHLPNQGGLTRFAHALIDGLLIADPEISIDYYISDVLLNAGMVPSFADADRVHTIGISDPDVVDSNLDQPPAPASMWRRLVRWVSHGLARYQRLYGLIEDFYRTVRGTVLRMRGRKLGKHWYEFALTPELVAALGTYDTVYFPFPWYIEPASIASPVVATFHDLNHLYFPGNFGRRLRRRVDRQLRFWIERADVPVASTRFIERDLSAHYRGATGRCSVVYVAPYSFVPVAEPARLAALERFGLRDQEYLIYSANQSFHKNLLGLVRAADLVKRREGNLKYPVVFTGFGTDGIGLGKWPSFAELDRYLASSSLTLGDDVRGLGFVTDEEVDALTRSARLVVSTSLYEAGCGPALDAWQFGVPVAFSNIPPFVEQLDALGVEAWTFDPKDPEDIARVVGRALTERQDSLAMAARSREAIKGYTWKQAAEGYLKAFELAIEHYRANSPASGSSPAALR